MKPPRTAILLPSLLCLVGSWSGADVLERVLVRVGGEIVTQTEFEARQLAAVQSARIPPSGVEAFLRENNSRLLQEAIDELLILQRGQELGIRPPASYLDTVIENIKKENNIQSDEEMQRQLRQEGMTLQDLRRNIERSVIRQEVLRRELQGKAKVADADVRAEYEAVKDAEYVRLPSVHLLEIVLPAETTLEQAEDVVRRARGGEEFGTLARSLSTGSTRESGGELGRLSKGDLAPAVESVAFALEAGAVSDPLPLPEGGFRILKVMDAAPGHVVPFEDVKDQIRDRMMQKRASGQYEQYVQGLRKEAEGLIQLKVREAPLQVTLPPEAGGSTLGTGSLSAEPPAGDTEFSVTPQGQPERVAPPPPAPEPSPAPQAP
jgi:peptidyl-prolyl cis-trans isomerase SurA